MKITKQRYVEYVISTPINYTCTNLAAHLEQISHDTVRDCQKTNLLIYITIYGTIRAKNWQLF